MKIFKNFDLSEFDLIIDAIDDIPAKVALAHLIDFKKQILSPQQVELESLIQHALKLQVFLKLTAML